MINLPKQAMITVTLLLCLGCSKASQPITGTVSYQNQPLNYGRIYFNVNNGTSVGSSEIQQDGSFSIAGIAPGEAKVAVIVAPPVSTSKDPAAPKVSELTFKPVVVPEKFSRVETSGVSVKLDPSIRDYKIDLK